MCEDLVGAFADQRIQRYGADIIRGSVVNAVNVLPRVTNKFIAV